MRRATFIVVLLLLCPGRSLPAQQPDGAQKKEQSAQPSQKPPTKALTNADIVGMVKAGLAESTIVLAVQRGPTDFDTSPQALIALKNEGVPQKVLDAMLTSGTEKPSAPAVPSVQPPTNATGGEGNGKWDVSEEVSPIDGSRTVALSLKAEQSIPGMVDLGGFPLLVIRCKSNQADAFIHTGSLPFDSDRGGKYSVRLRLDDGQPFTQYWSESTSYDSLFEPNSEEFARQLAASRKLAFEYTPLGSGPVATWFDLAGLEGPLVKVADACGWSGQRASTEGGRPDLHAIRKVFLEIDSDNRNSMRGYFEKHTCLQVVDTLRAADAIFVYTVSASTFLGKPHYRLLTKDRRVVWEHSGLRFFGPLNDAVGCQK